MNKKRKIDMTISQKITTITPAKSRSAKKSRFFHEMKEEMKRVSWTTKEELTTCTKIVLMAIFLLGAGIYLIDLFVRFCLNGLETATKYFCG